MRVMRLVFVLVIAFSLASAAPLAHAAELKMGYVNLAHVFDNYSKTKDQDKTLEQQSKQKERFKSYLNKRKKKDSGWLIR